MVFSQLPFGFTRIRSHSMGVVGIDDPAVPTKHLTGASGFEGPGSAQTILVNRTFEPSISSSECIVFQSPRCVL